MTITLEIDKELEAIREEVYRFSEKEIRPRLREYERIGDIPDELRKRLSELRLNGIDYPEEYGGSELGITGAAVIIEDLSWGDIGAALGLLNGPGLGGYAILELGSDIQKKKYLPHLLNPSNYNLRCAFCLLEHNPDFTLKNMETVATTVDGGFVLSGKKFSVINGDRADFFVVFAKMNFKSEIGAFIIDQGTKGPYAGKIHEKLGLNSVPTADVILNDVRVSQDSLLNGASDFKKAIERIFIREKIVSSALTVGCARAAIEYAFKYASDRKAFGVPIHQHQGLSFMMAEMAMEVDTARLMLWHSAWAFDRGNENALSLTEKAFAQVKKMSSRVMSDAVQILGGHGFIQDHPVEKWMRDTKTLSVLVQSMNLNTYL
jgi:alkylation response protein AidB-like acyl-CoA dehydrogenase